MTMPMNAKNRSQIAAPIDIRLKEEVTELVGKNFVSTGYRMGEGMGVAEFLRSMACYVIAIYGNYTIEEVIKTDPDLSKAMALGPVIARKLVADWDAKHMSPTTKMGPGQATHEPTATQAVESQNERQGVDSQTTGDSKWIFPALP
jgi:hypothetical protein